MFISYVQGNFSKLPSAAFSTPILLYQWQVVLGLGGHISPFPPPLDPPLVQLDSSVQWRSKWEHIIVYWPARDLVLYASFEMNWPHCPTPQGTSLVIYNQTKQNQFTSLPVCVLQLERAHVKPFCSLFYLFYYYLSQFYYKWFFDAFLQVPLSSPQKRQGTPFLHKRQGSAEFFVIQNIQKSFIENFKKS